MADTKRILIIGGGASGLTAIKCCLDEGLTPVCLERTDSIGGLWNYTEEVRDGQACVMKSTVINTSKEMMAYSDFPIPAEYPNFMHNTKIMEYFHLYADNYKLKEHIQFNTEILSLKKAEDFELTGRWSAQIRERKTDKVSSDVFDGVMVCTGHHAEKYVASFPGMETFKGQIVHAHDYKSHKGYEDKRVVVVGIGNSGGDVSVELSRVAKQVYTSSRRGCWVIHRIERKGMPTDLQNIRRFMAASLSYLPSWMTNTLAEFNVNQRFDHAAYGLQPKHHFFSQHPMVNDDLPNRIANGGVILKPNIKRVTSTGVEFEDGTVVEDIDTIILATGYVFGFPFIDESVLKVNDNKVNLFKYEWIPDLSHPTLAVIGCIQPWGAIMPISELQARWAARVFKGDQKLPSREEMWQDVNRKSDEMSKRYFQTRRHTIQVDYIPFMDELAEQLGCKPDLHKLIKEDWRLALACFFGPCTPYQYRIHGPGRWDGAKEAIATQWDRVAKPFKTRIAAGGKNNGLFWSFILIVFLAIVLKWLLGL